PERAAELLYLMQLQLDRNAGQPADDLGEAALALLALREDQVSLVRTVGYGSGREPGVDLIELLLAEGLEVADRQLLQIGSCQRKLLFHARKIGLPLIARLGRRELDVGGRIEPGVHGVAAGQRQDQGGGNHATDDGVHRGLLHIVARKAISGFLSESGRFSPNRWPSFSMSAVHVL